MMNSAKWHNDHKLARSGFDIIYFYFIVFYRLSRNVSLLKIAAVSIVL